MLAFSRHNFRHTGRHFFTNVGYKCRREMSYTKRRIMSGTKCRAGLWWSIFLSTYFLVTFLVLLVAGSFFVSASYHWGFSNINEDVETQIFWPSKDSNRSKNRARKTPGSWIYRFPFWKEGGGALRIVSIAENQIKKISCMCARNKWVWKSEFSTLLVPVLKSECSRKNPVVPPPPFLKIFF